jgi:hypothetical protein
MADGFIVRRGGKATEQALTPTITKVSETDTSVTFTLKNNDTSSAVILYEIGDTTPDANSIELAADTTSSNIEITGLTRTSALVLYATANVTGKVKSNVAEVTYDAIVYTAATGGTTEEYDSGGKRYKSHTFTSNGTFEVTTAGNGDRNQVDYLIIAGGGGGGGGGGGAGGFRTTVGTQGGLGTLDSKVTVTATSFSIVIGAGGASFASGVNSSALGITSTGGGRGAEYATNSAESGGSGGGGAYENSSRNQPGAAGTANQGFAGGGNRSVPGGSGGGGAGQAGSNAGASGVGSPGGDGLANLLRTGSNETRAGGGGGGGSSSGGTGGSGGGGNGDPSSPVTGTVNTGGGGGGSWNVAGVGGGSGIVVIRYEIAPSV